MSDVRDRVRAFILRNFYVTEPDGLGDDTSFLERGIVDSTGVLEVVGFLEGELGVPVADEELVPQNLDSVAAISAFVARKRGG
jgi:acyl carrier protein